jgi:hypothetical protein
MRDFEYDVFFFGTARNMPSHMSCSIDDGFGIWLRKGAASEESVNNGNGTLHVGILS